MPVAIAPVDRKLWAISVEFDLKGADEFSVLVIDGTDAAKHFIVMSDLEHSLRWNISASKNILEEGNHVFHSFGPAKRNY
jgi:hypothetical protein